MTAEQKERYVELITKVGSVQEINELSALILIEQEEYAKEKAIQFRMWDYYKPSIDVGELHKSCKHFYMEFQSDQKK